MLRSIQIYANGQAIQLEFRGHSRLAEVFFILILARILANRIGWGFMQSQIIKLYPPML